jgi:hypothetical protein
MDTNVAPNHQVPKWSETRWSGCWNPDEGVGLYLHMGRFRKDLDMWWAQTVAYLPDRRLVVDRSFGRQPDDQAIRTGNFELAQKENGFISTFDGVAELTTTEELAAAPRGAGAPSASVSWEVEAEGSAPLWDLYAAGESLGEAAGDSHVQQAYDTTGSLIVDGEKYSLDGVGYKDHSSGVRKWDGYGSHNFVVVHMPDWTGHLIAMNGPDGETLARSGAFFRDGSEHRLESFEMPIMADALGGPKRHELTVKPVGGDEIALDVEVLHQCAITITDDGDNINGIDWEASAAPVVVLGEGAARFTGPDGEVGYGFHERGILRDELERPAAAGATAATQAA